MDFYLADQYFLHDIKGAKMTWTELRTKCKRQSDYIITLFITNEVSLSLTWVLFKTRVTPNQVTVASILSGFGCALSYAFGYFIVGSLLLFSSHVLDCTDGNLARAKSLFSPFGKWFDMAGDRITEAMIFTGIGFYFIRTGASEYWTLLALGDAILLSTYYYIVDIGLTMGLAKSLQNIGRMKFKNVNVKWGLLEPVTYGLILLSPLGLLKVQITIVLLLSLFGISFQIAKRLKTVHTTPPPERVAPDGRHSSSL
jgi:phosphatidylglycerophosphate synthase